MFANFHGLNVKLVSELRRLLRQAGAKYFVTRKTLVKKALEASSFGGEMPKMEGETAVVYTEGDPLSSASALNNFAKTNKFLKILGGIFESQYVGADRVIAPAGIPSREVPVEPVLKHYKFAEERIGRGLVGNSEKETKLKVFTKVGNVYFESFPLFVSDGEMNISDFLQKIIN